MSAMYWTCCASSCSSSFSHLSFAICSSLASMSLCNWFLKEEKFKRSGFRGERQKSRPAGTIGKATAAVHPKNKSGANHWYHESLAEPLGVLQKTFSPGAFRCRVAAEWKAAKVTSVGAWERLRGKLNIIHFSLSLTHLLVLL